MLKLVGKFGAMRLVGFVVLLLVLWFGLGYLKKIVKGKIQSLSSNFDNERKMA